ncbi:MAG: glycosyltransferase [Planctomycetes bacterium]|nr:glycosyltransferase [Planctomycetota bacterium]
MSSSPLRVVFAIPILDDWTAALGLLQRLDTVAGERGYDASVLFVDDGSSAAAPANEFAGPWRALREVEVLRLARNLGHQRAIAIGLTFLHQERPPRDAVVVMDGDGEDRPEDVPLLLDELERLGRAKVVFAERARRSEGVLFRGFYQLYRALHLLLTGISVRVGNFSAMPWSALGSFVVVAEAWNHYAAAVFKARLPRTLVPIARGTRIAGTSSMNFVALAMHGLSAISVFGDVVGVRLLVASSAGLATFVALFAAGLAARSGGALVVPDWVLTWCLVSILLCLQLVILAFVITFSILSARNTLSFLPSRDYAYFVSGAVRVFPRSA